MECIPPRKQRPEEPLTPHMSLSPESFPPGLIPPGAQLLSPGHTRLGSTSHFPSGLISPRDSTRPSALCASPFISHSEGSLAEHPSLHKPFSSEPRSREAALFGEFSESSLSSISSSYSLDTPSDCSAAEKPFLFLDPTTEACLLSGDLSETAVVELLRQSVPGGSCQWLMLRNGMSLLRMAVHTNRRLLIMELLKNFNCRITDTLHHIQSISNHSITAASPSSRHHTPASSSSLVAFVITLGNPQLLLLLLQSLDLELELQSYPLSSSLLQTDPALRHARSLFSDVHVISLKQIFLSDVPLSIYMLFPHLQQLLLQGNPILYLHPAIGYLTHLKVLDLRSTSIEILPTQLNRLKKLHDLKLPKLRLYPELICSQAIQDLGGTITVSGKSKPISSKDVLQHLPSVLPNPELITVVLGERGTGKSSLIAKLLGTEKSMPHPEHGFLSNNWSLKRTRVKVWDFGSNKTLDKFTLPVEALYIVVFNLAQDLSQAKLDYWLQRIRAAGTSDRQPSFILVGTHRDVFESGKNDPDGQLEVIGQFLESKFPRRRFLGNVCPLYSICTSLDEGKSSKKFRRSFKELRAKLKSLVQDHPFLGPVPVATLNIGRALLHEAESRLANSSSGQMMEVQELSVILKSHGLVRSDDMEKVLRYLENAGRIFFFGDSLQMKHRAMRTRVRKLSAHDLIVLDVQWFAQKLSRTVAQIQSSVDERGIFTHDRVLQWTDDDARFCHFALPLMLSLGIAHPLPHAPSESDRSLLADLLPAHKPPRVLQLWVPQAPITVFQFTRVFRFRWAPVGFFPRFLSWVLQLPDLPTPEDIWKTGILLCCADGHQALITFNEELQQLTVEVRVPCAPPPRPPRRNEDGRLPLAQQIPNFHITSESTQDSIENLTDRLDTRKSLAISKPKSWQLRALIEEYIVLRANLVQVLKSLEDLHSDRLTMMSVLEERINEMGCSILECQTTLAQLSASSRPPFDANISVELIDEYMLLLSAQQEETTFEILDEKYEGIICSLKQYLADHLSSWLPIPVELIEERISSARLAQNQCRVEILRSQPIMEMPAAEEPSMLRLAPMASNRSLDSTSLMQQVILVVMQLLECYFPASIPTLQRKIACSHCLNRRDPTAPIYFFSTEECLEAIHEGRSHIYCCGISTRRIHLATIAPDMYFSDMPSINPLLLEITSQLGAGGYGIVWKGFLNPSQNNECSEVTEPVLVAVKEMISDPGDPTERRLEQFSEFRNEVFMHSALRHPHIVRFYGVSLMPRLRMVLEFCNGPNLYQLLHDQECWPDSCFSAAVRVRYAHNIASAMTYLHSQAVPIVHCDLRSPNVFLTTPHLDQFIENAQPSDFVAKVADFGLARKVFTSTSGYLGTWQWLPPEITLNSEFTEKADVYSFAIIMWELFSRKYPFEDNPAFRIDRGNGHSEWDVPALKQAICYENLRPIIPPLPLELEPYRFLMEVGWRTSPEERPHMKNILVSMSSLCRTLGSFVNECTYDRMMEISVTPQPFQPDPIDTMIKLTSVTEVADQPLPKEEEFTWEQVVSDDGLKLKASSDPSRMSLLCALPAPDLDELLVGYGNGEVGRFSTRDWSVLSTFTVSSSRVYDIIRVDGSFWICSEDSICIYDPRLLQLLASVSHKGIQFQQICLASEPSSSLASPKARQKAELVWASSPNTGSLLLINSKTFKIKHTLRLPIEYSPTALLCVEQTIWVGTFRGVILIYDLITRRVINNAQIGDTRINKMIRQTPSDPKSHVWICSNDSSILVYSPSGALLRSLSGHTGKSRALAAAGNFIWSGAFSGRILVFDWSTFRCLECWLEKNEEVSLIEFFPPNRIIIGYRNGVLRIYTLNLYGTDFANLPSFTGMFVGSSLDFSASTTNLAPPIGAPSSHSVASQSLASQAEKKDKRSLVSRLLQR